MLALWCILLFLGFRKKELYEIERGLLFYHYAGFSRCLKIDNKQHHPRFFCVVQ